MKPVRVTQTIKVLQLEIRGYRVNGTSVSRHLWFFIIVMCRTGFVFGFRTPGNRWPGGQFPNCAMEKKRTRSGRESDLRERSHLLVKDSKAERQGRSPTAIIISRFSPSAQHFLYVKGTLLPHFHLKDAINYIEMNRMNGRRVNCFILDSL